MTNTSSMKNKVCIVTGANTGIGFEVALGLAREGAHTVLVCRDAARGEAAVSAIRSAVPGAQVDLVMANMNSVAGAHALADALIQLYPHIHVLVNNAGVWMTARQLNADSLELSFMVNHLAPFILNQRLRSNLMAAALPDNPARIINVNAGLYMKGAVDIERTPIGADFGRIKSYANSKLCNVLTLAEEARQLAGSGVTINHVHPGVVHTGLGDSSGALGWLLRLVKKSWLTPAQGAEAPVWLASAPELAGVSGAWFNVKEQIPLAAVATDAMLSQQVWDLSTRLGRLA